MEPRRVAVLGSNSFSGADFIDLLLEDERTEVVGISRSPEKSALFLPYKRHWGGRFRFYQMDLNRHAREIVDLLDSFKPRYIVNFAAQSEVAPSWEHPEQWFETNTVALAKLINALKGPNYLERYLHISSPEVYGTCVGQVTEAAPVNPTTPYAASKAAADLLLSTYVKNFGFPLITIRATNVYGAHQQLWRLSRVQPSTLSLAGPSRFTAAGSRSSPSFTSATCRAVSLPQWSGGGPAKYITYRRLQVMTASRSAR